MYVSLHRTLVGAPSPRRDLIKREKYLVPNSIVVTRGCPHHCDFCYKDAFYQNGKSFYTQLVDDALKEIDKLPGRHLYFLDNSFKVVPRAGLEPARKKIPQDFKSCASTDFATKAQKFIIFNTD